MVYKYEELHIPFFLQTLSLQVTFSMKTFKVVLAYE